MLYRISNDEHYACFVPSISLRGSTRPPAHAPINRHPRPVECPPLVFVYQSFSTRQWSVCCRYPLLRADIHTILQLLYRISNEKHPASFVPSLSLRQHQTSICKSQPPIHVPLDARLFVYRSLSFSTWQSIILVLFILL